jgi:hypothetical protein
MTTARRIFSKVEKASEKLMLARSKYRAEYYIGIASCNLRNKALKAQITVCHVQKFETLSKI